MPSEQPKGRSGAAGRGRSGGPRGNGGNSSARGGSGGGRSDLGAEHRETSDGASAKKRSESRSRTGRPNRGVPGSGRAGEPHPRRTGDGSASERSPRRADRGGAHGRPTEPERGSHREPNALRPELPADLDTSVLDSEVRRELATLPTGLADLIGGHLVAAGLLLDEDPEAALAHARFARSRAGRVAVVREATGLAAYRAGEWSEALTELRATRRLSGRPVHLAVMADCERALGRPDRALDLTRGAEAGVLGRADAAELRIVGAGARRDMGQLDAAVVALQGPDLDSDAREPWVARLRYAYADNLLAAGRREDALRWFLAAADADDAEETDAAERAIELGGQ